MKLVINIPEEIKNKIDNATENNYVSYMRWFETILYCAIKNGTPLPKKHGRIIDESKITKCQQIGLIIEDNNITRCLMTDAPTIIETDKESEET